MYKVTFGIILHLCAICIHILKSILISINFYSHLCIEASTFDKGFQFMFVNNVL